MTSPVAFMLWFLAVSVAFSEKAYAEEIKFQCSWDNSNPIGIAVDTNKRVATRDVDGKSYEVIKATRSAIWLADSASIDESELGTQMIQRAGSEKSKGGKWMHVSHSPGGTVTTTEGGICWEPEKKVKEKAKVRW